MPGRAGCGEQMQPPCRRGWGWVLAAVVLCWSEALGAHAQKAPLSERIANALLQQLAEGQSAGAAAANWDDETGRQLEGLDAEWYNTANGDYFRYVKSKVDAYLDARRSDANDKKPAMQMTDAMLGRELLLLYRVTLAAKYYEAATELRNRLGSSCGIASAVPGTGHSAGGGSSLCMAEPFLAEYAAVFREQKDFAAITKDLLQWDDANHQQVVRSRGQPSSGAIGDDVSLAAALVDSLPYYPPDDEGRTQVIAVLDGIAAALAKQQNAASGALNATTGVPVPPPAACLYIYAILKGVRLGYLPARYSTTAQHAWESLGKTLDHLDARGAGIGAVLLAATEVDLAPTARLASGETVMVDAWYNSQQRKNAAGQMDYFHYKWSDFSDSGYSLLGHLFQSYGMSTEMLDSAPSKDKLSRTQSYIIVSPDIPIKNPNPHYMTESDAAEIASWVHDGGVLILMENDPPNADIAHLNLLADRFGIHFDDVLTHHIIGEHVEDGTIPVAPEGPVFHRPHTLYMKDTCTISLHGPATALLRDRGSVVMATAKYGRGTVFGMVDPWLYNEYTDGRKNPLVYGQFDNFSGGKELVRWLVEQHPGSGSGTEKDRKAEK